jgi:hypothetical protein
MALKTGKSFITIEATGLDEAKAAALTLAAPAVRRAAVLQGGEDAIEELRKYYAMARGVSKRGGGKEPPVDGVYRSRTITRSHLATRQLVSPIKLRVA